MHRRKLVLAFSPVQQAAPDCDQTPCTGFPLNMPDPIRIRSGSAGKQWPEADRMFVAHRLASGPDPFGQNLTQSARAKSDPGWFCTIIFIIRDVCGRTEPQSESGKLVAGRLHPARNRARCFLHTGLLPDRICLAKP